MKIHDAHWNLALTVLAAMLIGGMSQASAQNTGTMPPGYYSDDTAMSPSKRCQDMFPGGLGVPKTTVKHTYVVLFVFDNTADSESAGQALFYADPPPKDPTTPRTTVGCVADPDPLTGANGKLWGIEVKGGCPTDCTGPGLFTAITALLKKDSKNPPVDDPLNLIGGNTHWGIFSAPLDGGAPASDVRVWQVQTKNAVHAARILNGLAAKLGKTKGYMGHLLIGHRPLLDPSMQR
jgi:hypothetical protein